MKIEKTLETVKKHLQRTLPGNFESYVRDPRGKQGRQWKLKELLSGAMAGMISGGKSCGDVENVVGPAVEDQGEWFCSDASCASAASL